MLAADFAPSSRWRHAVRVKTTRPSRVRLAHLGLAFLEGDESPRSEHG
jgi:hypothetical protein